MAIDFQARFIALSFDKGYGVVSYPKNGRIARIDGMCSEYLVMFSRTTFVVHSSELYLDSSHILILGVVLDNDVSDNFCSFQKFI